MVPVHHNPVNLLRAAAVVLVFCHHYAHYFARDIPFAGVYGGLLGVQLFFLISGFLIVQTASRHGAGRFLVGRAFRILPAYWFVVLAFSVLKGGVFPVATADLPAFAVNLLALSHAWPYALVKFDVLTVSWTLTVEWTWYLLAPALAALGARFAPRHARAYWSAAIAVFALVSVLWVRAVHGHVVDPLFADALARVRPPPIDDHLRTAFMLAAAPAQWVFFLIGVGIHVFRADLARVRASAWVALGVLVIATPGAWGLGVGLDPSFVSGLGLGALFVAALKAGRVARWRGLAPLQSIGDWSYPLYLVHVPVILSLRGHVSGWTGLVAAFGASLAVAWTVHRLVEQPGRALGQRLLQHAARRAPDGVADAARAPGSVADAARAPGSVADAARAARPPVDG